MGCVVGAVRMMTKWGMYGGVNVDGSFNAEWLVECTVRAHPTSQFSQRATPPRSDDKKDEVIKPPTKAIIVRFFGVLIYRRY
jgi:hypothetical protein